jgi:hypothetical protein
MLPKLQNCTYSAEHSSWNSGSTKKYNKAENIRPENVAPRLMAKKTSPRNDSSGGLACEIEMGFDLRDQIDGYRKRLLECKGSDLDLFWAGQFLHRA